MCRPLLSRRRRPSISCRRAWDTTIPANEESMFLIEGVVKPLCSRSQIMHMTTTGTACPPVNVQEESGARTSPEPSEDQGTAPDVTTRHDAEFSISSGRTLAVHTYDDESLLSEAVRTPPSSLSDPTRVSTSHPPRGRTISILPKSQGQNREEPPNFNDECV